MYYNAPMIARIGIFFTVFLHCTLFGAATAAELRDFTGSWVLNESASGSLDAQINQLKQEERDYETKHGSINDPDKPDPFGKRKRGGPDWDPRRSGPVPNASINTQRMLNSALLKLYVSERIIVSYDGEIKRRVQPNPAGRVYSATGKGVSSDAIGETLAYLEEEAFVIETLTTSAERLAERFEMTADDRLKITTTLKNPEWRREIAFIRYYERQ